MDNKSVINGVLAMLLIFMLWVLAVRYLAPPPAATPQPQSVAHDESTAPPSTQTTSTAPSQPGSSMTAAPTTTSAGETFTAVGGPAEEIVLGDANAEGKEKRPYPMELRLTTRGAAVVETLLSDYDQEVRKKKAARKPYRLIRPVTDAPNNKTYYAMATESVTIIKDQATGESVTVNLADVDWRLMQHEAHFAAFVVDILRAGEPLLRVTKTYELPKQPRQEELKGLESGRHDVKLTLAFENLTKSVVVVGAKQLGPTGLSQEMLRTDDRHVYAAYRDDPGVDLERKTRSDVAKQTISWDVDRDGQRMLWTAVDNQYFAGVVGPGGEAPQGFSDLIARVEATKLAHHDSLDPVSDVAPRIILAAQHLAPGEGLAVPFDIYLGPKSRPLFTAKTLNPEYERRGYVTLIEKNYASCTFAWLANLMIAMLTFFGWLFGNYGVAILVLVLIVRTILHPLTVKQQLNMTKMQRQMATLQPKMEEVKKKYANDKAKQQEEMMKLYRDGGINPAGQILTCLPMLIQMPIWVALWTALSSSIEMRHAPFIFWIRDLTAPDAVYTFSEPFTIPLLSAMIGPIHSLNLLPILLSITMYAQQKLMPKAHKAEKQKSQTTDQLAQQQKIMSFMLVFFGVLFYNAPSGLNLYIMASNIFGMLEQWRVRKHIKEEEAKGKFEPKPKKSGLFSKWAARLEKLAEEARKQESDKSRRKRA